MRGFWAAGGLALIALALAGCESMGGGPGGSAVSDTNAPPLAVGETNTTTIDDLRVGDRVTVILADIPTNYGPIDQRIREDGTITLPLDVKVTAAGKRAGDLEAEIQREYVPRFFRRITVSVKPEDRFIYVGGFVRMPNRYLYVGEMTVLKAIKVAGDFTDYANKGKIELTRANKTRIMVNGKKALKEPKYDLPVYPGDSIYVHQRFI